MRAILTRRRFWMGSLTAIPFLAQAIQAADPAPHIRGHLEPGSSPALVLPDGRRVKLEGDAQTMLVLNDERLKDSDFETLGQWKGAGTFTVGPLYSHALFAYKGGKRLVVSYWCDVCYIRTWSPGKCWCCQKYTDLDLMESDQ